MGSMWWLILIALGMGLAGLAAFLWSLRNGQYDDLDGAAERVLLEEDPDETGKNRQERR
ncbi:cbb3-type cytochrome oxidase assembly protein CcoS [Microvirga sp. BT688]|uniref:cbb3-type cytochrome oxidase assembly protein CcoS n=1 Tax=Microvirga sp. TaxID=1873136 RepID=UPI001686C48A|nr:cbb3-type cytochrome oxidase assembly protein CcoS [Microvirga sp.]MBD2748835.1 cbb3-type cytochrome oxidase assembly protein CcoS [Microvirga sp.]